MKASNPGQQFTVPQISTSNPKDWFVYFRFFHAGKWHLRKFREGINRIGNKRQKMIEAEGLCNARHDWLKMGWNPITDPEFKQRSVKEVSELPLMPVNKALDYALKKKVIAKGSRKEYKSCLRFIKETISRHGYDTLPISQLRKVHVKDIVTKAKEDRNISNHTYNKYLDCFRSMLSTLEEFEAIEFNPAAKLKHLPVAESNKYVPLTEEEKEKLTRVTFQHHFGYFTYLQVLYHTGIRPKEALALKIKDVDLKTQTITIAPNIVAENSKTKKVRRVPINPHLEEFLRELGVEKSHPDYFLFGRPEPVGTRAKRKPEPAPRAVLDAQRKVQPLPKRGAMRPEYFRPNPLGIKRDTATVLWRSLVCAYLGISKHQYAMKHTGADDKILAGIPLEALRELYGHRSVLMTETYAREVKKVYRKEIMEKSPAMAPYPLRKVV